MKKTLLISVVLLLVMSVMMFAACSGEENITALDSMQYGESESAIGESIYRELENIGTNYKNRSFGTVNEENFALYLDGKLGSYGYENVSGDPFTYSNGINLEIDEKLTSRNVIYKKDAPDTDKAVLITSQMDNMYDYNGYNDEGIYAGATGMAIMLELAKNVKDMTLPFDVYFVAFGANSMSLKGAAEFYDKFYINHEREDTLLMIDLSKPIGGDHMYMYTDEVTTEHSKYLYSIAHNKNYDFRPVPDNKQEMDVTLVPNQQVNYTHAGIMSSNIFFVSARIPSVNFLSVNWEAHTTGDVLERAGKTNITSTKLDNFEFFTTELTTRERLEKESFMVYDTIMTCFVDPEFVPVMTRTIENMPDYSIWSSEGLIIGLRVGLAAVIIIVAALISSKLKRDLPSLSMNQFMNDIGIRNAGINNMTRSDIDPFEEHSDDPFKGVDEEFKKQENEKKKDDDGSSDIFGI